MTLPTVAVSTIITNPYSSKYLAYLACLESWASVVDEVILVDGGTTDASLDAAKAWVSPSDWGKVRIINTPETYWHPGGHWHYLQAMHNYYIGLCASDCDWVFTINADTVLCRETARNLRQMLVENSDMDIIYFYRGKPRGCKMQPRLDTRVTAVNWKRARETGLLLGFGAKSDDKRGWDFPIIASHKTTFRDPVTNTVKRILAGKPYPVKKVIDLECAVFGHFFFDLSTTLQKLCRWNQASARYLGIAPMRYAEHRLMTNLYGIVGWCSKVTMMNSDHPPEILRVIDRFYEPGMLGGAIREVSPAQARAAQALRKLLGLERHLRTRWMRAQGYRGLKELHQWVPLDAPDPEPLDVARVYAEQDRFLPAECRVNNS